MNERCEKVSHKEEAVSTKCVNNMNDILSKRNISLQ